ncbi:FtsX-like permease family protein [Shewanella sp. UCD-KL12]|uniref:FtsX-like permease family protein n=1 Tax=Shewanella sp. UCD-KL12 TaxID=1917163 RepID=UPI0009703F67|nr:FtsX-like permease family protein [Shewanella sp. UCD-KL12]
MLFDLAYGWRKWRGQRGIWSILLLSLCLFCSLMGFVINLFWLLNSDRPQWVGSNQPIVTIASKDLNSNLQPTSGFEVDLMLGVSGVERVATIATKRSAITLGLQELPRLTIGFYSQSAIELLALPAPFSLANFEAKRGIVSQQFWQQHFEPSASSQQDALYYRDSPFLIAGSAPISMKKLGDMEIDLWLPDTFLQLGVPEQFDDNPDVFLKTQANRYGFAQLSQKQDLEQLQSAYRNLKQQTPRPEGGFVDHHFQPWLIEGVELNPNGRDVLQRQAWILLLLLAGFGFIIFSGIVSAYTQQGIVRRSEMSLKIALGGDSRTLVYQLLKENIVALAFVGIVSPIIGFLVVQYASSITVYEQYFNQGVNFNFWLWLFALFVSLGLFMVCALMPLKGAIKSTFSRGKQGHMTKAQQRATRFILLLQLVVITGVSVLSLSLMSDEWRKYSSVEIADDILSFQPKANGSLSLIMSAKQLNGRWSVAGNQLALSSRQFTQLGAQSLKYQVESGTSLEKPINGLYVSENYFSLLGVRLAAPGDLLENSVMLNQTMASQLANELGLSSWRATKGLTLKVSGFYYEKQVRIAGIVTDQPHFGIAQTVKPLIYLNLKDQNPLLANRIAPVFYSKGGDKAAISSHLNDWASLQSPKLSYSEGNTLVQQIVDTDAAGKLLFLTSSVMALLIIALVVCTLYNKFSYSVKSEQMKWAVMLAVGGQKQTLMLSMVWLNLGLTMLAIAISMSISFMLDNYSQASMGVSLLQPLVWAGCVTLSLLFIITITLWAARGVLKQNISTLLRL